MTKSRPSGRTDSAWGTVDHDISPNHVRSLTGCLGSIDLIRTALVWAFGRCARHATDPRPSPIESTYAMAIDEKHDTVLLGGLGGSIEFLDLTYGGAGALLSIPGQPANMDDRSIDVTETRSMTGWPLV